jgi:hypothetical protein
VVPKNPNNPPACYNIVHEYRVPPADWTHSSATTIHFPQKWVVNFPLTTFDDDALYRIRAAGNEDCVPYSLKNSADWVWTDWTSFTVERKGLISPQGEHFRESGKKKIGPDPMKREALSKAPGSEPMTPRSGGAPPGFGTALTASPAAVKTAGLPAGGSPPGGPPKVRIVKPTEDQTIFVVMSAPSGLFPVEVAPLVPSNPPGCYIARIAYKSPARGAQWLHGGSFSTKPVGEQTLINPTITYHKGSDHRVEVMAWKCDDPEPNPRDFVADDFHAVKYVVKENLGLKPQAQRVAVAESTAPAIAGRAALSKGAKTMPAGEPLMPRSGGAPTGFGSGVAHPATKLKMASLPPGNLVVDDFVLLTGNPEPGHTVDVKVKVLNTGKGPTVKDEWKLEVKCNKSPGAGACEQQLGATPLEPIPKGGFEWILRSGAVKVNSFGSYKLQANVIKKNGSYSGYLEFTVSPPRVKQKTIKEQAPVVVPGPDPQVQKTQPAPRKVTPRMQPIQVR